MLLPTLPIEPKSNELFNDTGYAKLVTQLAAGEGADKGNISVYPKGNPCKFSEVAI